MSDFADWFAVWLVCVIYAIFAPFVYILSLCYEAYLWAIGGLKRWVV